MLQFIHLLSAVSGDAGDSFSLRHPLIKAMVPLLFLFAGVALILVYYWKALKIDDEK